MMRHFLRLYTRHLRGTLGLWRKLPDSVKEALLSREAATRSGWMIAIAALAPVMALLATLYDLAQHRKVGK